MGNKYFPELNNAKYKSKYGILNVGLIKTKNTITGYQWCYKFWNGEKVKLITSYDLRRLREKILAYGDDWIITDNKLAIKSYKFNNELLKIHDEKLKNKGGRKYWGSSGVKHVTKQKTGNKKNKIYWVYKYNNLNRTDEYLSKLKDKVLADGGEWIIGDENLYKYNLLNHNKAS